MQRLSPADRDHLQSTHPILGSSLCEWACPNCTRERGKLLCIFAPLSHLLAFTHLPLSFLHAGTNVFLFLALIFIQIGVPSNSNASRIWFSKNL